MSIKQSQHIRFEVYDKKKKKLYKEVCGLGMDQATGRIILVDLKCDDNVGAWTDLDEDYELRIYLGRKRVQ